MQISICHFIVANQFLEISSWESLAEFLSWSDMKWIETRTQEENDEKFTKGRILALIASLWCWYWIGKNLAFASTKQQNLMLWNWNGNRDKEFWQNQISFILARTWPHNAKVANLEISSVFGEGETNPTSKITCKSTIMQDYFECWSW